MESASNKGGLKQYNQAEIESHEGEYDKDGFYLLTEGGYFDHLGYYFDKDGYNEIGGYYDPVMGIYISPDENVDEQMADYYDELCGNSEEEEEADNKFVCSEHQKTCCEVCFLYL